MRTYLPVLAALLFCCQEDENIPLVRKYHLAWESDIGKTYYTDNTLPSIEFVSLLSLSDGYVVFSRSIAIYEGTLTKTDLRGAIQADVTIEGEYLISTFDDGSDGIILISALENNYFRIRKYNSALELISQQEFDLSLPVFRKYFFVQDAIFRARADDAFLEKFDLTGSFLWRSSITEYGFPDFINPLYAVSRNSSQVTLTYVQNDMLNITHIDSRTGKLIWKRKYSIAEDFGGADLRFNYRWGANGRFYFAGSRTASGQSYLSVVVLRTDGSLHVFKEIPLMAGQVANVGTILPTSDNGAIISLGTDVGSDTVNFRLLKIDSKGNPGWMGTFQNSLGFDYLSGMVEHDNGDVVFLTYYGYMASLKADYSN